MQWQGCTALHTLPTHSAHTGPALHSYRWQLCLLGHQTPSCTEVADLLYMQRQDPSYRPKSKRIKILKCNWMRYYTPIIPALKNKKQEFQASESGASLSYLPRPCLKTKSKPWTMMKNQNLIFHRQMISRLMQNNPTRVHLAISDLPFPELSHEPRQSHHRLFFFISYVTDALCVQVYI